MRPMTSPLLLIGGTAATMSATVGRVEMIGFALVAALGAFLVWRKSGALAPSSTRAFPRKGEPESATTSTASRAAPRIISLAS